ncbi:MAG: quinone-dependent dihydroorotate dehydrogenase [Saprospiraceae bacterium]|nr:quinone-dependent dihydroorotate dehydrogenase [Saprospiraceae bacterium]
MWKILRYLFFKIDAENAHYLAMDLLSVTLKIPILNYFLKRSFHFESDKLKTVLCGMKANNPIGLAAGFDKDGRWLNVLAVLGFGHIELGTVTPLAQVGNEKPRLFRLKKDHSIINRMGFNNQGAHALAKKLQAFQKPSGLILGGNIGKNKITPAEKAVDDYLICFKILYNSVDYFTINVSSPNTPGLRQLQDKEPLGILLSSLQLENERLEKPKPLFLKIAPDLDERALDDIIEVVKENRFSGIIISNTTTDRPLSLIEKEIAKEAGGLSGEALTFKAKQALKYLQLKVDNSVALIGVGGIMNSKDAFVRMECGADWIQIYSGMIYEGPWFVKKLKKELSAIR